MSVSIAEALNKISKATVTEGGNYVRPGNHVFEVERIHFKKGYKGLSFIADLITVESEAGVDKDNNPVRAHRPGERTAEVQNLDGKAAEMAPAHIKAFVCGLLGLDPNGVSEDEVRSILGGYDADGQHVAGLIESAQPAKGMRVACVATERVSQKGKTYTNKKWIEVKQTNEEVAARRATQEGRSA